jgi:hypothetical protein
MGESKRPIFTYVDESGNTGKNIFDKNQPDFYTAALISKGDFDVSYGHQVKDIAQKVGADAIHANELGLGRLEGIAGDLRTLIKTSGVHFFVSRVEKRYLLATKMFDVLFDSGENAAVAWHNYNLRPMRLILAFKLASIIDDSIAHLFWDCLLLPREEDARMLLPEICEKLKARLSGIPDARSRELLKDGLEWVMKHPECVQVVTEQKIAKQGHFPNLVAFSNLLAGLQEYSKRWKKKIARITHDEQNEFGKMLRSQHHLFSNAAPDVIEWAGEKYSLQKAAGSEFVIKRDDESPGIQLADVSLWLYGQHLKGKTLPPQCARLLELILERGWHSDFSFQGVHDQVMEEFGEVLFGPTDPEQMKNSAQMLRDAETRRRASMEQYERDGLPPFMRSVPELTEK